MSSHWFTLVAGERAAGLRRLAGSRVSGVLPVREALIDHVLARWRPPAPVEAVRIRLLAGNLLSVRVAVRVFGFRKTFELALRIAPALEPGPPRRLYLFHADRSLLSNALGFAGPVLPAWLSTTDSGFVADLDALASRAGAADVLQHLGRVAFDGQAGVLWINFEAHVAPVEPPAVPSTPPPPASGAASPARGLEAGALARLMEGARVQGRLRVEESLLNEAIATALADGGRAADAEAGGAGDAPRTNWREIVHLGAVPQVTFESGAVVVDATVEIAGRRTGT